MSARDKNGVAKTRERPQMTAPVQALIKLTTLCLRLVSNDALSGGANVVSNLMDHLSSTIARLKLDV